MNQSLQKHILTFTPEKKEPSNRQVCFKANKVLF